MDFSTYFRRAAYAVFLIPIIAFSRIGSAFAHAAPMPPAAAREISASLTANVPDGFTVAAVGDLQLTHAVSPLRDPGFQATLRHIKSADVAFGNLETTLFDPKHFTGYPAWNDDALRPVGTPRVAHDLRLMGFRMVSRANNHALDWGIAGMRETNRLLDAAGIVHSGTGYDLAAARSASYLETPEGRIALISVTSTFAPTEPALPPLGLAPGRPGVNALRTKLRIMVDAKAMRALRRIESKLPEGAFGGPTPDHGPIWMLGKTYAHGSTWGFRYQMNKSDLKGILHAITQGKLTSDFLIVNIHCHQPGNWSLKPPNFLPTFAHDAIDAGADMVIAEGPHQLRGIEIYKGKPIFYSLGNFFFQIGPQQPVAEDMYQKLHGNPNQLTDAELNQSRIGIHVVKNSWAIAYQSVVAVATFRNNRVSKIHLFPIVLTKHGRIEDLGIPQVAQPQVGHEILNRLAKLSKPYGTTIHIQDDVGIINE